MLTHSRIVERSMERSLHVEARGRTIVFGTYLDVIRDRLAIVDRRMPVHIGELVKSARWSVESFRRDREMRKTLTDNYKMAAQRHRERYRARGFSKIREKTRPRGSLAF